MMSQREEGQPVLRVCFYRTASGSEPVREWIMDLERRDRRIVGQDVKTAQYGWPLGMPLIRKIEPGMWEVRSHLSDGIARVIFTVRGDTIILLHGFVKKTQKAPRSELAKARRRAADLGTE
jgi:phage-related protein